MKFLFGWKIRFELERTNLSTGFPMFNWLNINEEWVTVTLPWSAKVPAFMKSFPGMMMGYLDAAKKLSFVATISKIWWLWLTSWLTLGFEYRFAESEVFIFMTYPFPLPRCMPVLLLLLLLLSGSISMFQEANRAPISLLEKHCLHMSWNLFASALFVLHICISWHHSHKRLQRLIDPFEVEDAIGAGGLWCAIGTSDLQLNFGQFCFDMVVLLRGVLLKSCPSKLAKIWLASTCWACGLRCGALKG